MQDDQTPNVNITPDPNSPEAKYFDEQATEGDANAGTGADDGQSNEPDYKEKFSASTRENQRIREENKTIQEQLESMEAKTTALAQEKEDVLNRLKEEKPESYDAFIVNKELGELKQKLVLQEEKLSLDEFYRSNPDVKIDRERLRDLGRNNPSKSYEQLYNEYVKPVYEAGMKDYESQKNLKKQTQPESGVGSADNPPIGKDDLSEINSMSLDERRRYFKKIGL